MKTVPPELQATYEREVASLATCWKITRTDDVVLGFTDHDRNLEIDGVTYSAFGGYTASAVKTSGDLSVDNLELQGILDSLQITEADLDGGLFDYAEVLQFEVDYTNIEGSPVPMTILRRGNLGEVTLQDIRYIAELRGLMQYLQQKIVETYQFTCRADFGSQAPVPLIRRCGFDLSTVTVTGTITSVTDRRTFADALREQDADWFNQGALTFLTGDNAGRSKEIKTYGNLDSGSPLGGEFQVVEPFPNEVQIGDTYSAYPGCDKTPKMCRDRYNWFINFKGEPYIMGQDEAARVGSASDGSNMDIFE